MTYCLGMLLDEGLILMADTRTNAGVDNFSIYKKLHLLADGPGSDDLRLHRRAICRSARPRSASSTKGCATRRRVRTTIATRCRTWRPCSARPN
jgi:hypothetical protein